MKRIRLAYRHLTESNEVYQPRAGHKCLCRYVAVTLRDLERHRQSGYTKYDGRAAVSYNRVIWCCYCGDHVPYTPRQFYGHMMKMHNVVARLSLPVVNQCPFCGYCSCRQSDVEKTLRHIQLCRSRFKPNLNLHCSTNIFDLPLFSKTSQPRNSTNHPSNVNHAGHSSAVASSSVVTNLVTARPAVPPVALGGVAPAPPAPVAVALYTAAANALSAAGPAATYMLSYLSSLRNRAPFVPGIAVTASGGLAVSNLPVPVVPVASLRSVSLSTNNPNMPHSVSAHTPNIYSNNSARILALNCFRPLFPSMAPLGSVQPQTSGGVVVLKSTDLAQSTAQNITSSGNRAPVNAGNVAVAIPPHCRLQPSGINSATDVETVSSSHHDMSAPVSTSSEKPSGGIKSSRSPIVALRRLSAAACEICGSVFENPVIMRRHLRKAHCVAVTENDLKRKPLQCVCCSMQFFSKQGLNRHMQIVHDLPVGEFPCTRCSETGITDLIEHFHVKHNTPLRMMCEWRVCYICKMNFSVMADVENHAASVHADIFPSRQDFRDAIRASLKQKNKSGVETQKNLSAPAQPTSTEQSHQPQPVADVNRKRRHSVIEIVDDNTDLNSSDSINVEAAGGNHKQQANGMVGAPSSKTVATVTSHKNEPVTKKARRSSTGTAELQNNRAKVSLTENAASKENSASALEKGAILGTVSHVTKNKAVELIPLSGETRKKSGSDLANKPAATPDVSVRLIPLSSVSEAASSVKVFQTKESTKSSGSSSEKPRGICDISIHIKPVNSLDTEGLSVQKDKHQLRFV